MKHARRIHLATLFTLTLTARESFDDYLFQGEPSTAPEPWFTGPILTPSGHVVPEGHQNYEPYIYWSEAKARYNANWKSESHPTFTDILFQVTMQFGVLPNGEFDMVLFFVFFFFLGVFLWWFFVFPFVLFF